jgi:hypothetical protein
MTRQREFKKLVRERMSATGERYATARAHLLAKRSDGETRGARWPGVHDGYGPCGGTQADVAALAHALSFAGLRHPDGSPIDETTAFGLCGGIGFLYAVFEYKGHPPMLTIVARSNSMPVPFVTAGLEGAGVPWQALASATPKVAAKHLDEALADGVPVLCHVDLAGLPYHGTPPELAGAGPHVVGVVGRDPDSGDLWLDDRAAVPLRVARETFDAARAIHKKSKHWLVRIDPVEGAAAVLDAARIRAALQRAVRGYDESPAKSFASNIGIAGLTKWARLLVDRKDAKAWCKVFSEPAHACTGLRRTYDCLEHDYTAPAAGRSVFADFVRRAAGWLDEPELEPIAKAYERSAERWSEIARTIAGCDDAALAAGCARSDERAERLDGFDGDDAGKLADAMRGLWQERGELAGESALDPARAAELFEAISGQVAAIAEIELPALERLGELVGATRST